MWLYLCIDAQEKLQGTPTSPKLTSTSKKPIVSPEYSINSIAATFEKVDGKLHVLLPMRPKKGKIIDELHPDKGLVYRSLQQTLFQPTHKKISIGRSKLRAYCCP